MLKSSFGFKVGRFNCLVISDGLIPIPAVPEGQLHDSREPCRYINIDVMCLLVETGEHTILIDTGCGTVVEPAAGKLLPNLQSAGKQCTEVDMVILSHGHGDHIGGITDAQGNLVFPNARYVMHRKEWEFWTSHPILRQEDQSKKDMFLKAVRENLLPVKDRMSLVDDGTEIVSGIKLLGAPGHTPGNLLPVITSGAQRLLYIGDIIHHVLELAQPDLYKMFDILPERAMSMREHILSKVMRPGDLVFSNHFPFPGVGHIGKKNGEWQWQPV